MRLCVKIAGIVAFCPLAPCHPHTDNPDVGNLYVDNPDVEYPDTVFPDQGIPELAGQQ